MKALSLTQCWATLLATGAKKIETRSWSTSYRGTLAIHAAKWFPREAVELCFFPPYCTALKAAGINRPADLPRGSVIAVARLVHVGQIYHLPNETRIRGVEWTVQPLEEEFGNYQPGRFAWVFEDIRALAKPIPCRGALGLWDVLPDVEREISEQIGQVAHGEA